MSVDKEAIIKQVFDQMIPFNQYLGFELTEIRDGYAKMRVPFKDVYVGDPRTRRLHGGIIATAMDAIGGAAGITTLTSFEDKLSTVDLRIDYLHGTQPAPLIVDAEIIRSGNRIITTHMRAWHEGSDEDLVAEGRGVYSAKRANADSNGSSPGN